MKANNPFSLGGCQSAEISCKKAFRVIWICTQRQEPWKAAAWKSNLGSFGQKWVRARETKLGNGVFKTSCGRKSGTVMHAVSPSTPKAEAGGLLDHDYTRDDVEMPEAGSESGLLSS